MRPSARARAARGEPPRTPVDWALQWVWEHPEVSLVLSGMSTLDQVRDNVASAGRSGPGTLTADELAVFPKVRKAYQELASIPCTACKYCEPCPNGVEISEVFKIYNDAVIYGATELSRMYYGWLDGKVESCTQCGECEPKCPQSIAIVDWLEKAQQFLAVTQK
jgi:predicted aldo/keto reductase-like oxidoreductase